MCTQREILQNDLLRSAKLGPWQKEKQQLKMGVLFYFSVFSVVFPYVRFFYRTNKGVLSVIPHVRTLNPNLTYYPNVAIIWNSRNG